MPLVGPRETAPPRPVVVEHEVVMQALVQAQREDVCGMMTALTTLPVDVRARAGREVIAQLAQADVMRAARVVQAMPVGILQAVAVEEVARALVARDSEAAVQWALAWPEPATAFIAREAVAGQWAERAGLVAVQRLQAQPATMGRDAMVGFAVAGWARRDATAALAWVRDLPTGEARTRAATSAGFALAQVEPARAREVVAWLPEARDRWLLVGAIGQTWVARDAAEAWRWARDLPAGAAREAALAGIETGLGGARAQAPQRRVAPPFGGSRGGGGGATIASALAPGAARDEALRREFDSVLQESTVRAALWLETQLPPDRWAEMADELARRWLPINPEAAKTWMEQNILSLERREQLIHEAGR